MLLAQLKQHDEGQGLIEYALIVLLIAIVVIVVLTAVGGEINGVFSDISNELSGAGT
ncbi:Flp family type IVb pilin [Chloroflexota bacterium]|nr:Flp family type IVb pilin [Chloroflexota bacterium]